MKKKIIKWLFENLIDSEDKEEVMYENIYTIVAMLYKAELSNVIDKQLNMVIFDAKYQDYVKEDVKPSTLLQQFYKDAGLGKKDFMGHYFFRILRQNKDKSVSKINYKYKRNAT